MYLARLEVTDFRNHPHAAVDLQPGPNLFVGPNGMGKTNLLEAVAYLATLSSWRAPQDAVLVRAGQPAAVLRAVAVRDGRRLLVEAELRPGSGVRGRLNRAAVTRPRDLVGAVRAVVFAPEDLGLVRGDPDARRRLLDGLGVQRLPRYLSVRQEFERILRQRNTLLRSAAGRLPPAAEATLDVWDERLATAGAEIWAERLRVTAALQTRTAGAYREIAGQDQEIELAYQSSLGDDAAPAHDKVAHGAPPDPALLAPLLRERLTRDRRREVERGLTLTGPHRDELLVTLAGLPSRTHSSHGEAWSLALALRLASHRWLTAEGEQPVLMLDDVFAELDLARRTRLARLVADTAQTLVTATGVEEIPAELTGPRFAVTPGSVIALPFVGSTGPGSQPAGRSGAEPEPAGPSQPGTAAP